MSYKGRRERQGLARKQEYFPPQAPLRTSEEALMAVVLNDAHAAVRLVTLFG